MAFRETIWLRNGCREHCQSLNGSWLSTPGGSERVQTNGRHHARCSFEKSAFDGSANFDCNNVPFKPYGYAARQSHADSDCSSNAFDCARANDSQYNRQAL